MFEGNIPWKPLFDTLMDPTSGVVKGLQSKVRFGFSGYRSITQPNPDPECPKLTSVDFALDNYAAINAKYTALGAEWKQGVKWETPTGAAVKAVAQSLSAFSAMPPGPKYILLVTDGNPDTCVNRDPQCGQDEAIKAVQDAKTAGIGTFAIGIGDILTDNAGCVGRCGELHLQDLANAGAGLPVAPNSDEGNYQVCTGGPANVKGTYAATTDTPGKAPYYTATTGAQLKTAIQTLLNGVVSCTVDMNAIVTGDASHGIVTLGGKVVAYNNAANGWKLESNNYQVTLTGSACTTYQGGGNPVHIAFPCEPDGTPIAVPR
jgi:hypothetical protein